MLGLFLMGTLFFFCSCVDDTYDLNKGITTDVALKDNKLSLPLGSLRTVMLDSLINVDSLDFLNKKDGIYSISMADTIAPYEYEMPEIKFAIPAQKANVSVDDFAKAEITEVSIEAQSPTETQFDVPSISLDGLEIPAMNTDRSVSAANDMVKDILKEYEGADGQIIETLAPIPFDQTFELSDGVVEFDMSYELPKEIEAIYTIYLQKGDDDKDSKDGALIGFDIIHPVALTGLDKIIDFEINFPEEFIDRDIFNEALSLGCLYRNKELAPHIEAIFSKIEEEYTRNDYITPYALKIYTEQMLLLMIRSGNEKKSERDGNAIVEHTMRYIQDNYMTDIRLSAVAKLMNVSAEHLSRIFKKETSFGFSEYITLYRLQRAEYILINEPGRSICEIAYACGFNDSNYFSYKFKEQYGISPSRARGGMTAPDIVVE